MSQPTPQSAAQTEETGDATSPENSFGSHVLSIVALLMGVMFMLVYLLLLASGFLVKDAAATGLGVENSNYILAIGVGLLVLGVGLQFHNVTEFFRQGRSMVALNSLMLAVLAFALLILVNYVAARQNLWRWDLTSEQMYSLTEESLALVASLEEDVRLLVILPSGEPHTDALNVLVDQYVTGSPRVTTTRYMPETMDRDQQTELLEQLEVTFYADLIGIAVQSGRQTDEGFVALRSRHLRLTDLWRREFSGGTAHEVNMGEQKISSAIVDVTRGKSPRIYFLEGHEETSFTDFQAREGLGALGRILRSKNYDLAPLNLRTGEDPTVPEDADVLVVAGPKRTLGDIEVKAIEAYVAKGGDALLLLEPALHRAVAGQPRQYVPSGLEPLLRGYGVEVVNETLMFLQQDPSTGQQFVVPSIPGVDFGAQHEDDDGDGHGGGASHVIVNEIANQEGAVIVYSARPFTILPGATSAAKVTELVKTAADHTQLLYRVRDPRESTETDLRPGGIATLAVAIEHSRGSGDEPEATNPARLVVVGDVDVANNEFVQTNRYQNLELIQNSIAWLVQAEDRIVGKAARPKSYRLDMQLGQVHFFALLGLIGLPSIPIGLGVFVWLLRRK